MKILLKMRKRKKLVKNLNFLLLIDICMVIMNMLKIISYVAVVKKIEKIVLPEATEELIQQLSGKKAKTVEELTNFTKDNYEKYYSDQSDRIFDNSLLAEIVKNNDFDPSKGYVKTVLERLIETEKQNAKQYKQPIPDDKVLEKT